MYEVKATDKYGETKSLGTFSIGRMAKVEFDHAKIGLHKVVNLLDKGKVIATWKNKKMNEENKTEKYEYDGFTFPTKLFESRLEEVKEGTGKVVQSSMLNESKIIAQTKNFKTSGNYGVDSKGALMAMDDYFAGAISLKKFKIFIGMTDSKKVATAKMLNNFIKNKFMVSTKVGELNQQYKTDSITDSDVIKRVKALLKEKDLLQESLNETKDTNLNQIFDITKRHQAMKIKFSDKKEVLVDAQSANLVTQVFKQLKSPKAIANVEKIVNTGTSKDFNILMNKFWSLTK